jgi:hypothetical protein
MGKQYPAGACALHGQFRCFISQRCERILKKYAHVGVFCNGYCSILFLNTKIHTFRTCSIKKSISHKVSGFNGNVRCSIFHQEGRERDINDPASDQ